MQRLRNAARSNLKTQYLSKTKLGLASPFELATSPTVNKEFSEFIKYKIQTADSQQYNDSYAQLREILIFQHRTNLQNEYVAQFMMGFKGLRRHGKRVCQ